MIYISTIYIKVVKIHICFLKRVWYAIITCKFETITSIKKQN